jgi:hypothetical protein
MRAAASLIVESTKCNIILDTTSKRVVSELLVIGTPTRTLVVPPYGMYDVLVIGIFSGIGYLPNVEAVHKVSISARDNNDQ